MGALSDIKVLDLTRVLAGPYATMVLADLGAEIIKIEQPGKGDDSRAYGPYKNGESAYFMSLNRNKESVTLNLKTPEGKEILKELVKKVDVLVENFRPGTMEKLGLGYDVLKELNPRLIYASSTGYGQTGPYSQRPAYDAVVQAMGGIMSITGQADGKPTRVGSSVGDIFAGLFCAIGILSAVHERESSGLGQMVDVAMLDCQVAILENAIARYEFTGEIPHPIGNRHPSIVPFEPFDTLTAPIMVAAGNDRLWVTLCELLELDLANDPRFITNPKRNENYQALRPILAERFMTKTAEEWQKMFDEVGIPSGPINTVDKVVANEQVIARDMILEVEHPVAGTTRIPGIPTKLSRTPGEIRMAAPVLGAETEKILSEYLGLTSDQVAELREKKVI
ncbi:MAG TPA: CaiB/BaiF CoA-transferase family protein [Anaerolineaceae bacterium]|nr:CaiB/BaiF CoA-transferase family protein [Anaerolineaceae bacterium]